MASGMFTAAVAWWKETTDVTILCSPWVCRPVGRWVRTGTILANVFWWACFYLKHPPSLNGIALQSRGFASLDSGFNVLIVILMWYFWAASLWYYFMAAWESFSGSLFFALGALLSSLYLAFNVADLDHSDSVAYLFAILCHSNVHPLIIALILACGFYDIGIILTPSYGDPFARLFWVHMQTSFCIAWVAFLLDFKGRVRMASADSEAVRPKHAALRICCWLGGLNNWAQLLAVGFIKFQQENSRFHMLDNHVPMCTLVAIFVGIVCILLTCIEKRHRSLGLADSTMACFTCLPGVVLLADWAVAINTLPPRDNPFLYTFVDTLALITFLQSFFALQLLTLARCHRCICIIATTICTSLGCCCWSRLFLFEEKTLNSFFLQLTSRPYVEYCFLYVLVLASHLLDTWQKGQANRDDDEGFELGQLESTQGTNEENPETQARSWYERRWERIKASYGPSVCMSGAQKKRQ